MAMIIRTVSTFTFNGFFSVVDGFCFPADDVSVFCVDLKFILYLRIVGFPLIERDAVVIVRLDVDVSGMTVCFAVSMETPPGAVCDVPAAF